MRDFRQHNFGICIDHNDRYQTDHNGEPMDFRNTTVVGLAVAVGMGVTQANMSLAQFPEWVTTIFGKSPVVLATIVAIVLNLTLPRTQKKAEK